MPELPEVEAWVRELDPLVSRAPIARAGPAHVATLKTFAPPIMELEGRRLEGARRRGKNLLFPVEGSDLVLRVHLMLGVVELGHDHHLIPLGGIYPPRCRHAVLRCHTR